MGLPEQRARVTVDGLGNVGVGKWKVDKDNKSGIISDKEEYYLSKYIGKDSYIINEKLRGNITLTNDDKNFIRELDNILNKLPKYNGDLIRSVNVEKENLKEYLYNFVIGEKITFNEYISATKNKKLYNPESLIQIAFFDTKKGVDICKYNNQENEVLYKRNSSFKVLDIIDFKGKTFIKLEEL